MVFAGKNAVILGGCGGLGISIAKKFLEKGVKNIALLDICDQERVNKVLGRLNNSPQVTFHKSKVENKSELRANLTQIRNRFNQIDILVNSAGIPLENNSDLIIAVNFNGVVNSSLAGIELMGKNAGGRGGFIVNLASTAGLYPTAHIPVYSGTKHAVIGFTRALSSPKFFEAFGIKFLTICPGFTRTPILHKLEMAPEIKDFATDPEEFLKAFQTQTADVVGDCVEQAMEDGENGAVWKCEAGKVRKLKMQFPTFP